MTIQHNCGDELRKVNLKATPTRIAILKLLEETDTPMDVASIIGYLTKHDILTDPVTVFRIINTFTQKGLTRQIQFHEGKFRYELASKADHHHLLCEHCGAIEDLSDCEIGGLEEDIRKKKHFVVTHHALEFFGICKNCQKKKASYETN